MLEVNGSDRVIDILGDNQNSFEVPPYQRRYVWNKTNWKRLWKDILDLADIEAGERGSGHFTGPIVTRETSLDYGYKRYEVIDGQQRLTTLEIIFCVIKDLCQGLECFQNDDEVLKPKDINQYVLDEDQNQKFVPTQYDQLAFKKIVKEDYGKRIHDAFDIETNTLQPDQIEAVISEVFNSQTVSLNILGAYNYFYEEIRKHVEEKPTEMNNLFHCIISDFRLIHLSLGGTEQAEKVFESMNATGRMLSEFDYLRNNLFLRARKLGTNESDRDKRLYRDIFYEQYWLFEESTWGAKKLESFFQSFLMAAWDPKCFEEKNAKSFDHYLRYSESLVDPSLADIQNIENEFQQLNSWAESYENLQEHWDFELFVDFCKDLSLPDNLDSFLLFIKHNKPDEVFDVCVILESYIVRRMLVLQNEKRNHGQIIEESYENITEFFSKTVKGKVSFSTKSFADSLKESWPNNCQVMHAFQEADDKDANFIDYVFRGIEQTERMQFRRHGLEQLKWGQRDELAEKIKRFLTDPDKLKELFIQRWPPPCRYTK